MFDNEFYQTQKSEIFVKTQCMFHEHALNDFLTSILITSGYQRTGARQWQKHNRTVIVCLADDFKICTNSSQKPPAQWFDANTTVITDNWLPFDTDYELCKTPDSYFGIYSYDPELTEFVPVKRFHISMNRLDSQRLLLYLEFTKCFQTFEDDLVNFNSRFGDSETLAEHAQQCFDSAWTSVDHRLHSRYQDVYAMARKTVPFRNHNLSIEQAAINAHLNIVIETYAGDQTIAFSEKVFRALVTPAPWTLFSARNAIAYLRTLGFDTLDDVVDHGYDSVFQDTSLLGVDKIQNFAVCCMQNYHKLCAMNSAKLSERCVQAAQHNRARLAAMAQQWPQDCANWLPEVIDKIQ